jgi:hypothetical protein
MPHALSFEASKVTRKSIPHPSYLDGCESLGFVHGERRWKSPCGKRIYTWDAFHGEIEVFNKNGKHLMVLDAHGNHIKNAVKGRKIDV